MTMLGSAQTGLGSVPTAGEGAGGSAPSGGILHATSSDGSIGLTDPNGPTTDFVVNGLQGFDTSLMAEGQTGWVPSPGIIIPTNNLDARASCAVAVLSGGKLRDKGPVEAQFTTQGGRPGIGAPVWLAASSDDSNTGRGKLTATRPPVGVPQAFLPDSITPMFSQNVVQVGICVGNANYDSVRTARVELSLPMGPSGRPPADQFLPLIRETGRLGGVTQKILFTGPTASTQYNAQPGQTFIVLFSMEDLASLDGLNDIVNYIDLGLQEGWWMGAGGSGFLQCLYYTGGVLQGGWEFLGVFPRTGLNCVAWSILPDNTVRVCFNGDHFNVGSVPAFGVPVANYFRIGGCQPGFSGWTAGGVYACGALNRVATDAELIAWSGNVNRPPTLSSDPTNRFVLPYAVVSDPALMWRWSADDFATTIAGPQGTADALTNNGGVVAVGRQAAWYRNLIGKLIDTYPPVYTTQNYPQNSPGARIVFNVATAEELCELQVALSGDEFDNGDNGAIALLINGVLSAAVPFDGTPTDGTRLNDGNLHWFNLRDFITQDFINAHAPPYTVELVGSDRLFHPGLDVCASGTALVEIAGSALTFETPGTTDRLVLVGDGTAIGHDGGPSGAPFGGSVTTQLRADFPGRVTCHSRTSGGVGPSFVWGNGSQVPFARYTAAVGREGDPGNVTFWCCMGFEDYFRSIEPAATFGARYGQFLDALHAAAPSAAIYAQKAIQDFYDAVPNLNGDTLEGFNDEIDGLAAGRAWLTIVDARVPNAITFGPTNNWPTQPVGATAWKENIKAVLGY